MDHTALCLPHADLPPPVPPAQRGCRGIMLHTDRVKLFAYDRWTAAVSPAEIPEGNTSAGKMTSDNPLNGSQLRDAQRFPLRACTS